MPVAAAGSVSRGTVRLRKSERRIFGQSRATRVVLEEGAGPDWEETCRILTLSLKKYSTFHWEEIAAELGDDAYGGMQHQRENRVWVVDPASIEPRPRRSILDYASVGGAGIRCEDSGNVVIGLPASSPPSDAPHMTCAPASMAVKTSTLTHAIDHKALKGAPAGLLRDIMGSFYSEITLSLEEAAYAELFKTDRNRLADVMEMERMSEPMTVRDEKPLSRGLIASAAAKISRKNRHVSFPDGLVCLASPEQAMQLIGDSAELARHMNVAGIDVLATPVIGFDQSRERHVAFVVAKRSIRVALSQVEVDASRTKNGIRIAAQYAAGVTVDPGEAVRVESWRR